MVQASARLVGGMALVLGASALSLACGPEKVKYTPLPAYSGQKASLPPVPNVTQKPEKAGDAYTVWGASYALRSRTKVKEVKGKEIKITGYVIKTNLADAPACAVHKAGKADPEGCKAPLPTFWLADSKDADVKDSIQVLGWASNFAQLYDAIEHYHKERKKDKVEPKTDTFLAVEIPNPLPVKGMKVTIEGNYNYSYNTASGTAADPIMGVLGYKKITYLEKVEEVALLPGMKLK
jgi:hypothetical protein